MEDFQARKDFLDSLKEVDCLLELARKSEESHPVHSALLKSSILLLASKLESFIEAVVEECRYYIERCHLDARVLPPALVAAVLKTTVDDALTIKIRSGNLSSLEGLKCLLPFLSGAMVPALPIEVGFSYGKHGEVEFRKIFKRLGIDNVFDAAEEVSGEVDFSVAVRADINSLTAIRNNIIHNDASPSFTVEQVDGFVNKMKALSSSICTVLLTHCKELRKMDALLYEGM